MKDKPYHHGNLQNQLIKAGIELINEIGLKKFSLRKVAAKCNVSHAAPYSHFKDKDALIRAMGDYVTDQFMKKFYDAIAGQEESPRAVSLLGQAYIDFFTEHPQYFQFIFYSSGVTIDLDRESPEDYPPFALFRKTAYSMFQQLGLPEEVFTKQLIAMWSMVHGIASLLTNQGIHYSGDWKSIFTDIFMEGEKKQ